MEDKALSAESAPEPESVPGIAFLVDIHAHLYPFQAAAPALDRAWQHLIRVAASLNPVGLARPSVHGLYLCWVHPADSDEFWDPLSDTVPLPEAWESKRVPGGCLLRCEGRPDLHLVEGRQFVTTERLEVLGLGLERVPGAPLSCPETLDFVRQNGGVPILSWAVGKWLGKRGRVVHSILEKAGPGDFFLGDSALRPGLWPEPGLFDLARQRGIPVLAGSDPLPLANEELRLGTYLTFVNSPSDGGGDVSWPALKAALYHGEIKRLGKRLPTLALAKRWIHHWWNKQRSS